VPRLKKFLVVALLSTFGGTATPAAAQNTADQTMPRDHDDDDGFDDWGLLGLLGLAGLMGRKRQDIDVVETRRD
jgi:hypothetical protein